MILLSDALANHSRFRKDLVALPHLRSCVCKHASPKLVNAYNASLDALKAYRDKHVKIVTLSVLGPPKCAGERQQPKPQPIEKADQTEGGLKGIGGSELFSLLKDMRADMDGSRIRQWLPAWLLN
jgi:indoleamine 2,3-dioxygenase